MSIIRLPEVVWRTVYGHLFGSPGEHFAFLLADCMISQGEPVFIVHDARLVADEHVRLARHAYEVTIEGYLPAVNAAVAAGQALIEVHNHGGVRPRFSRADRRGFAEFAPYALGSLPGRPYAATVWGEHTIYGECFHPGGDRTPIRRITVVGDRLRQVVSRDDDEVMLAATFDRQLPWFTSAGQRALGRLQVGVVGAGGTGSQVIQQLAYLGVRYFVLIDHDTVAPSNLNRLVTATPSDISAKKVRLAHRLITRVAPETTVVAIDDMLQSPVALDALKGVDVIFGCVDNDGARLILNELALAYTIPYLDLGVGIDVEAGCVTEAGGRVTVVLPGGPCLCCLGDIDAGEAQFFLSRPEDQARQIERGYVRGFDAPAPAVISLNAAVAAAAVNEFAVLVSGVRPVAPYTELDLLGLGRSVRSQWLTPRRVERDPDCVQCAITGQGDRAGLERRYGQNKQHLAWS